MRVFEVVIALLLGGAALAALARRIGAPYPALVALAGAALALMPGVTAYDVELLRRRLLAETASPSGPDRALLELRHLTAHYIASRGILPGRRAESAATRQSRW